MKPSISIVGLGTMGRPMARKLIDAGYNVRGWNRSTLPENLTAGIHLCQNLEQASRADVLGDQGIGFLTVFSSNMEYAIGSYISM